MIDPLHNIVSTSLSLLSPFWHFGFVFGVLQIQTWLVNWYNHANTTDSDICCICPIALSSAPSFSECQGRRGCS